MREKSKKLTKSIFSNLSDWQVIQLARHPERPYALDYLRLAFTEFEELHGDRAFSDDPAIIGGLAGLATAFGLLITRLISFTGTPLGWIGNALYGTYTASLGTGEMTPSVTSMFIGIGWWLLLLAMLSGAGSVLLLCRAGTRMSTGRKVLGWSRGVLATLAVVSLFSLLALLFLETIHHGNLIHDLDSFSDLAPVAELLLPDEKNDTFHDIREKYKTESADFMIGVLTFAVLPLICFGGVAASLLFDER